MMIVGTMPYLSNKFVVRHEGRPRRITYSRGLALWDGGRRGEEWGGLGWSGSTKEEERVGVRTNDEDQDS
jgi:hypothetical protein